MTSLDANQFRNTEKKIKLAIKEGLELCALELQV